MRGPNRRTAALGLGALGLSAALGPRDAAAQMSGMEVLAPGVPGDGGDQLARAIAEGLATTKLTPRAIPVNVPLGRGPLLDFLGGARPRASMMVIGLSTVGALKLDGDDRPLDICRPLAALVGENQPLVVPAQSPFRTVQDLVEALRRDPQSVTCAGREVGGADHQLFTMLALAIGVDPKALAYRVSPTTSQVSFDVLTNKISVGTGGLLEFLQQIRGGTVRALALASPERSPDLDLPTLREQGVDVAMRNWRGVVTRQSLVGTLFDRLGEAIRRLAEQRGWREMVGQREWTGLYQPAEGFGALIAAERARIGKLYRDAGMLPG